MPSKGHVLLLCKVGVSLFLKFSSMIAVDCITDASVITFPLRTLWCLGRFEVSLIHRFPGVTWVRSVGTGYFGGNGWCSRLCRSVVDCSCLGWSSFFFVSKYDFILVTIFYFTFLFNVAIERHRSIMQIRSSQPTVRQKQYSLQTLEFP